MGFGKSLLPKKYKVKCSDCGQEFLSDLFPLEGSPVYCSDCSRKHGVRDFKGKIYKATCQKCGKEFALTIDPTIFMKSKPLICKNCS